MDEATRSKIRIKLGPIEVEYEGSESFLKEELPDLLGAVARLYKESGASLEASGEGSGAGDGGEGGAGTGSGLQGTTGTIAAKLVVKSGPDLILAGCARLTFVSGSASFTRKQITDEIKSATGYYKKTYLNNLSTYLQSLVKDQKLVEPTTGTFALSVATKSELEKRLAQQ